MEWISVKDSLPKFDTPVLVHEIVKPEFEHISISIATLALLTESSAGKRPEFRGAEYQPIDVSHWMPLPEPPKQ